MRETGVRRKNTGYNPFPSVSCLPHPSSFLRVRKNGRAGERAASTQDCVAMHCPPIHGIAARNSPALIARPALPFSLTGVQNAEALSEYCFHYLTGVIRKSGVRNGV